ncbi:hypothetical protein [Streptomyces litchfieldiae]|uniref:Uncharacterized protein n=1 Tax=Streptomyces litchfieldiae TaxID=3075543 RepID=A0ABU2N0D3_9ACTN|nr:hypothetical protein [Streptomyces sp. DSM 44938]MDT0347067.1 hypothetical protein [Streptomyces sp. DSM 44938]
MPAERTPPGETPTAPAAVGPWETWPWCLNDLAPEAARAANAGVPAVIIWHFQRAGTREDDRPARAR